MVDVSSSSKGRGRMFQEFYKPQIPESFISDEIEKAIGTKHRFGLGMSMCDNSPILGEKGKQKVSLVVSDGMVINITSKVEMKGVKKEEKKKIPVGRSNCVCLLNGNSCPAQPN